jgi:hypothetical protein
VHPCICNWIIKDEGDPAVRQVRRQDLTRHRTAHDKKRVLARLSVSSGRHGLSPMQSADDPPYPQLQDRLHGHSNRLCIVCVSVCVCVCVCVAVQWTPRNRFNSRYTVTETARRYVRFAGAGSCNYDLRIECGGFLLTFHLLA